ncbi:VanZ family protein [Brachybacterium sp. DNPG3]
MSEILRLLVVGMVGGLGLFAIILLPAIWLQRRRFGRVHPWRLLGVAIICVYTMGLAGLTIAPAYDVAVTCANRVGGVLRADPFAAVREILAVHAAGTTGWGLLTSWAFLQLASNIALFVPLGAILRGVFRLDATTTLAIGLSLSVLIEATQYTGAWGLYPCGVRIADIDDVFANAFGAWIGALVAPLLIRWRVPLFVRHDEADGSRAVEELAEEDSTDDAISR